MGGTIKSGAKRAAYQHADQEYRQGGREAICMMNTFQTHVPCKVRLDMFARCSANADAKQSYDTHKLTYIDSVANRLRHEAIDHLQGRRRRRQPSP